MKNLIILILCIFSYHVFGQDPMQVGEEVKQIHQSPHPYPSTEKTEGDVVWREEIVYEGASYIAVHFNKVELAKGDFIVVKSPDGGRFWKYADLNVELKSQGRWSIPIYGEKAIIEIHSKNKEGGYGYSIDKIARGYTENEMLSRMVVSECGSDNNSEEAKCYENSEPEVYQKSRAVARLLFDGTNACTGWLIGSEGHLMTNNHCMGDANAANDVTIEFMAEGDNCNEDCKSYGECQGTIEATSAALIRTDINLDYSLLKLPNNPTSTYGYLQLRSSGPVLNERIYLPNHSSGWGKRISLISDSENDTDGFMTIQSFDESGCWPAVMPPGGAIGYCSDAQGGSSGSPVISYDDHLVVAIHNCVNGTLDSGNPIHEIIYDLGSNYLPQNSVVGDLPPQVIPIEPCCEAFIDSGNPICSKNDGGVNGSFSLPFGQKKEFVSGTRICLNPGFIADAINRDNLFLAHISECVYLSQKTDNPFNTSSVKLNNYPNPFTKHTTIEYTLNNSNPVTLFVSNIMGKNVSTLINNELKSVGKHQINFTAKNLPVGIYYYTIQAGNHIETQKMVLSK